MAENDTRGSLTGVAVFVVACVLGVTLLASGWKMLSGVSSQLVNCPVYDLDGGTLPAKIGTGDYNSIDCQNMETTEVYLGSVTSAISTTGYKICNASTCASPSFGMNTNQGELYCSAASDVVDGGGVNLRCIYGR